MSFAISHNTDHNLIPDTEVHVNDKGHGDVANEVIIPTRDGGLYGFTSSSAGKVMRFDIASSHEAWILGRSELEFDLELESGTTGYIDGTAHSLFNRMRLMTKNGTVIDDALEYNLKACIDTNISVGEDHKDAQWEALYDGLGVAEASKTLIDATAQRIIVQPNLNVFKQVNALHLPITGGLVLECYMERDNDVFSSGSANVYRVSNAKLRVHFTPMTQPHIQKLMGAAAKGALVYNFSQDYHTSRAYTSASDSISIQYRAASVNAVTAVWRLSTDANSAGGKYLDKFQNLAGLTSLQVEHASDRYPNQAYDSGVQVYRALKKNLSSQEDVRYANQLSRAKYLAVDSNGVNSPLFIYQQRLHRAGQHTGVNTDSAPLLIRSTATALANGVVEVFMNYSSVLVVFGPSRSLIQF